jgi:hypothetical protein
MAIDAFRWGGKQYDRAGFGALLRQQMQAARNDPKHAYNDRAHPQHAAAVADMHNAYRWLAGEVNEAEERELAVTVNETLRGENTEVKTGKDMPVKTGEQRPERQAAHRMNEIAGTLEGREALQRARTGAGLSPEQKALVSEYRTLELEHNSQAKPAYTGGTFKTRRPHYVAPELYQIEKIQNQRERAHAIRALKSQWLSDPKSAYADTSHPDHKSAVDNMRRLYEHEAELGRQPEDPE